MNANLEALCYGIVQKLLSKYEPNIIKLISLQHFGKILQMIKQKRDEGA
jgi:hypothetical protein